MPEEILDLLNLENFGSQRMEADGACLTDYGALIPKDGVPLMERLMERERQEQNQSQIPRQSFGMTMG